MCRWALKAPTPLKSILWPVIDPILVTFAQRCNFGDPSLVTFYLCISLILNEEHFTFHIQFKHSGTLANRKYEELSHPKNHKKCDLILTLLKMRLNSSQSSGENATPSRGTSPLASYEEVPPPPPPRAEVQPLTFFIYRFQEDVWTVRNKINGRCREVAVSGDSTVWMNNLQNFFSAIKCICQPFRNFYRPRWQISILFHILQQVKPIPFLIPEAWKRYLIPVESPRIGHYREYPPHRSLPVYVIIGSTPFPDCWTLNLLQWNSMRIYTDPRSLMGTGSSSMG